MRVIARAWARTVVVFGALAACAAPAIAQTSQTTVRVTQNESTIWTANFRGTAAIVKAGTVLTVVSERKDWLEVVVPPQTNPAAPKTGFIYRANVDRGAGGGLMGLSALPETKRSVRSNSKAIGFAGFGQFSYARFAAHDSFQAVMGDAAGQFLGGGAELRLPGGAFVSGSVERFTQTGQRVFVDDGEAFGLGIPDTLTLTPIMATAGWRSVHERATPYAGVGFGRILYKEESQFVEASENVQSKFNRYHVVGDVEFRNGWVATAFEVEYSRVPNALGMSGASEAFHETDLGGLVGRIKVLVGR